MQSLADFLNHGILPFVGRARELEQIVSFWEKTLQSDGMRSLLLVGEAGIGKSRLLQAASEAIEEQGGAVVHLKLYPESTVSIAPLLSQALWRSRAGHQLLRGEPDGTLPSAIEALRRFTQMRPTILVVEDVHLLAAGTIREFTQLLESIADESLALLCIARPVELAAQGLLERWPLDEIRLQGLGGEEIEKIWQDLFGGEPPSKATRALGDVTLGNALAIRSALLGAIKRDALVQGRDGYWVMEPSFPQVVSKSARSLSDGMTAHLAEDVRHAARQLACLGEIYSREAAALIVDERSLDALIFNGIVHELLLPRPPLPGSPKSAYPLLAFTHSLVHRQLVESASADLPQLIGVIAGGVPLYSILPFECISGSNNEDQSGEACRSVPLDTLRQAITIARGIAQQLDATSDWNLAMTAHRIAEVLVDANVGRWEKEELLSLQVGNAAYGLSLLRRNMYGEEFGAVVDLLFELTGEPLAEELSFYRLVAYVALARRKYLLDGYAAGSGVRHKAEEVLERFPDLKYHRQYIIYLQCFAQLAEEAGDNQTRREIEEKYEAMIGSGKLSDDLLLLAQSIILPHLLTLFETPEELARRFEMYEQLKGIAISSSPYARLLSRSFLPSQPLFLRHVGQIDELVEFVERELPQLKTQGTMFVYYSFQVFRLWGDMLLGFDMDEALVRIHDLYRENAELTRGTNVTFTSDAQWFIEAALIRGEADRAAALIEEFEIDADTLPTGSRGILGPDTEDDESYEKFARELAMGMLTPWDLIRLRAILRRVDVWSREEKNQIGEIAREALIRGLDWLAERRLDFLLRSMVDTFAHHLDTKHLSAYRKRAESIASEREAERASKRGDDRIVISMLGRIEVRMIGAEEAVQPRGARQKSFLGAMVACELVTRPLDRAEFLNAAGIEIDDSKLTRDAVNSAIYRLREVVGHDAIITQGETPRLNRDLIRVDLIEASSLLKEADEAMRRNAFGRAHTAVMRALELTRGEVPFPALYDSFFEALRDDFENQLRTTVMRVAERLVRESDAESARQILDRVFTIMPDDEEVSDLYCQALEMLGRRAEAEIVRRRMVEANT